jgi:hypothetical protein
MPNVPAAPASHDAPPALSADHQINRAKQLEKERANVMSKIGKNREFLRLMDDNGALTNDQSAWLKTFYPDKEKGSVRSAEEVELTRKLREAARKA